MLISLAIAAFLMTFSIFLLFWPWVRREFLRTNIQRFRLEVYETARRFGLLDSPEYAEAEKTLNAFGTTDGDLTVIWLYLNRLSVNRPDDQPSALELHPFTVWFRDRLGALLVGHIFTNTASGCLFWLLVITVGIPDRLAAVKWCISQLLGPNSRIGRISLHSKPTT